MRPEQLIETLSEALVLADPGNTPLLEKARSSVQEISNWARESGMTQLASWAATASELLQQVIRRDTPHAEATLDVVTRAAAAF